MAREARYVCLQETSEEECETWMYFLKYDGNEAAIAHLSQQLESVNFTLLEGCGTFDIDVEHFVSATTAKEVTKLELNSHSWHRKFDGKLAMIDLELDKVEKKAKRKNKDDEQCNDKKMEKIYDILGYGGIDKFIDEEDIDAEDRAEASDTDDGSESDAEPQVASPKKVREIPAAAQPAAASSKKAKAHRQRTQAP